MKPIKNLFFLIILLIGINQVILGQDINVERNINWDTIEYTKAEFGWEEGSTVPDLKLKDINGNDFMLYDFLDKVTIIDFWFLACKPCIANKKYLKQFYKQYDINMISISVDKRASSVREYAEDNHIRWTNIHDDNGFKNRFKTKIGYGASFPNYIVITPDKRISKVFKSGADMPKMGVFLQAYFSGKY